MLQQKYYHKLTKISLKNKKRCKKQKQYWQICI